MSVSHAVHRGLKQMWKDDTCTDFEIEAGNKTFRCHKVVLGAVSDYFQAMFNSGMRETEDNKATFDDISAETFGAFFSILYETDMDYALVLQKLSEEELTELLKVAGRLQVKFLEEICVDHIRKTMAITNCVERWKAGQLLICEDVTSLAWEFILNHFESLVEEDIFKTLEFDDLQSIVADFNLRVSSEKIVWSAIKKWVNHDLGNRADKFVELLQECRLEQIEQPFLVDKVVFDSLIRKSDEATEMVRRAMSFHGHPSIHGNMELRTRSGFGIRQFLLLFKATTEKDIDGPFASPPSRRKFEINLKAQIVDVYKSKSLESEWEEMTKLSEVGKEFAYCVVGDALYVSGGRQGNCFKIQRDQKTKLPKLIAPLSGHTMCATDSILYVMAGRSNTSVFAIPLKNEEGWDIKGELMAPVVGASSVVFEENIYVFGGTLGQEKAECVQSYDTNLNQGTIFTTLPSPTAWSRAVCRGSIAYVVSSTGEVIKVCLESGTCEVVVKLPQFSRKWFGIDLVNDKLSILGGLDVANLDLGIKVLTSPRGAASAESSGDDDSDDDRERYARSLEKRDEFSNELIQVDLKTGDIKREEQREMSCVIGCARITVGPGLDELVG